MEEAESGYRVAVKPSARAANEAVESFVGERGEQVDFTSEAQADAVARRLSTAGETPVGVQCAAPQDPTPVDAYLVADPERRTEVPTGSAESGLTFDVSGNQYGALGEALVLSRRRDPPLLTHVVREDPALDLSPGETERLHVVVDTDPEPVCCVDPETGERREWRPDCRAVASLGADGRTLTEYWCEVKTGAASFQRGQRAAMETKAREAPVLAIRVDVDDLPDSYTARVERVSPADGDDPVPNGDGGTMVVRSSTEGAQGGTREGTLDEFT
ncbi:hypothetical protein ACFO0N_10100 [Halobium salinum]|uniref:Uncharacterized protein n=1 Tax=Halobium salinum TaxID=1364940 RepID=A0ABD5PBM2_9EURY|nr:hypothetical protein [Halobium salinum]